MCMPLSDFAAIIKVFTAYHSVINYFEAKQLSFLFVSLLGIGQIWKENSCSQERNLSFKARPRFGRGMSSRDANRKS